MKQIYVTLTSWYYIYRYLTTCQMSSGPWGPLFSVLHGVIEVEWFTEHFKFSCKEQIHIIGTTRKLKCRCDLKMSFCLVISVVRIHIRLQKRTKRRMRGSVTPLVWVRGTWTAARSTRTVNRRRKQHAPRPRHRNNTRKYLCVQYSQLRLIRYPQNSVFVRIKSIF